MGLRTKTFSHFHRGARGNSKPRKTFIHWKRASGQRLMSRYCIFEFLGYWSSFQNIAILFSYNGFQLIEVTWYWYVVCTAENTMYQFHSEIGGSNYSLTRTLLFLYFFTKEGQRGVPHLSTVFSYFFLAAICFKIVSKEV